MSAISIGCMGIRQFVKLKVFIYEFESSQYFKNVGKVNNLESYRISYFLRISQVKVCFKNTYNTLFSLLLFVLMLHVCFLLNNYLDIEYACFLLRLYNEK